MGVSSTENTLEKTTKLDDFSTDFCSVCDTCDSKKQHRCWKARARVCTRELSVYAYSGLLPIALGGH